MKEGIILFVYLKIKRDGVPVVTSDVRGNELLQLTLGVVLVNVKSVPDMIKVRSNGLMQILKV